jgi:hypothetical protein
LAREGALKCGNYRDNRRNDWDDKTMSKIWAPFTPASCYKRVKPVLYYWFFIAITAEDEFSTCQ